jgi:hypothetical protein
MKGLGFRDWGLGIRVEGLGFRVEGWCAAATQMYPRVCLRLV